LRVQYVTIVNAFGFFACTPVLARGGVAKIGQIQLIQPLLTLAWSVTLLDENVNAITLFAAVLVVLCVVATQRTRVDQAPLVTSRR
jgi:drug/metabolite transporter (DMT)-like permease